MLGALGRAKPEEGTSWDVTLEITARKFVVDSAGKETDRPLLDLDANDNWEAVQIRQ